ncbi:MAG: threonine synthase [bacterium]
MTDYNAWFQCIKGCDVRYELSEVVYECEECGGLLEVRHDMEALGERPGCEWRSEFDRRFGTNEWPYGSGVWGKKEVVCPGVDNENVVSLYEGNTNLFWADEWGKQIGLNDLWIKQCGQSHTGSFKDLGMTVLVSMVNQMIEDDIEIPAIACASTGDTSASLAAYCAAAGLQAIVILPKDKITTAQLIQPISNNAITLSLETDFDGCMKIVQQLCKENNVYLANSMNSLRIEGQKTISYEIAQQFDWEPIDHVIIPGGNLGNVSALGKGFREMRELGMIDWRPRITCAQAKRANPLYQSYKNNFEEFDPVKAEKTVASAIQIGDPVSINKAIDVLEEFDGIVEQANAAAWADQSGLFSCPHTGVALAALIKLVKKNVINQDDRVVVISTATGLKFTDFKIKYHNDELDGVSPRFQNEPVECKANYESVQDRLFDLLENRDRKRNASEELQLWD